MTISDPQKPRVSVFIQSYNYGRYISDAIESVLVQTYQNFELIVIDDASQDQSPAIIEEFGHKYPDKIKFVNRTVNWGLVRTYNEGVSYINGDIFVAMSSDDLLPPQALEKRVQYFVDHPKVDILATDFNVMDHEGKISSGDQKLTIVPQFKRYFQINFKDVYTPLLRANFLQEGAMTISLRRIPKEEIFYDEACPNLSDYDLWLRLLSGYRLEYLAESTFIYRWHGENLSAPRNRINTAKLLEPQKIYVLSKQLLKSQTPKRRRIIQLSVLGCLIRLVIFEELVQLLRRLFQCRHALPECISHSARRRSS